MSQLSYFKTVVINTFLLSLVLFQITDVKAQKSFGIMAGVGKTKLSKINGSVEDFSRFSSRTSYWGGLTAGFPLGTSGFSLNTAAIYNKKGYDYSLKNTTGANNSIKDSGFIQDLNYIDIRLLLIKKFSLDENTGFFIGTGPIMNILMSGKEQTTKSYFGSTMPSLATTNSSLKTGSSAGNYKRVYPSLSLVAGVEYKRFSLSVNYNIPLDFYYLDARKQLQHSMKTFGVSLGYTIFRGKQPEKEKKEKKEKDVTDKEKKEKKEKKSKTPETVKDTLTDTDGDGITDINDKCPGHKGIAKYGGCPVPDADGDGIPDDDDKCPMLAGNLSNSGCPTYNEQGNTVSKDTIHYIIYFEPGKSELKTEGYNVLNEVIRLLKSNPRLAVQFNGHTDNVGSVEANSIRAFSRAMVCVDYVASFFIDRKRLTAAAFGNKKPVADLKDPLLQWKNRRVEVYIFEK